MTLHTAPDRVAIVSGGTTGIGLAIVGALRTAGMKVALFSSSPQKVAAADAALRAIDGPDFHAAAVDIEDGAAVAAFHATVEAQLGAVGTLVCNAGISPKRDGLRIPLHHTGRAEWDATMAVNLTGAFNCVHAALPAMMAGGYGRIVLIGSIASRTRPKLAGAAYVASKAALSGLMRAIVGEYSHHGITCNIVAPGNIVTEMVAGLGPDRLAELATHVPVGRLGMPEDIAAVVEMLCRPAAGFVNGAVIDVNGGEFVSV